MKPITTLAQGPGSAEASDKTIAISVVEVGHYATAHGCPGVVIKAARIAGYGFIVLGALAGAAAVMIILIGGLFMLPSIVRSYRRVPARYFNPPPRMLR